MQRICEWNSLDLQDIFWTCWEAAWADGTGFTLCAIVHRWRIYSHKRDSCSHWHCFLIGTESAPRPSSLRSLFCTKSAGDRRRERLRMGRERWSEGEAKNVSSNTTCHLILLKGQQLEIKTKFEINEAHSGGGIRFWSNKLLVSTSETAVPVCQLICLTLLLQTLMHSLTDTLAI